jgi:hypothetical protein
MPKDIWLAGLVNAEHGNGNLVTDVHQLAGVIDSFHPGHFADVNQSFDSRFEFDERTVIHHVDDFAGMCRADRVFGFHIVPWVGKQLFETPTRF